MLYLQKILNQTGGSSANVMENISELFLTYRNWTAGGASNCMPVMQLFDTTVDCLINSYPKEWLVNEIKRDELLKYDLSEIKTIEPWWKLILGNKALLPLLWSMYPNHPNLLPAFYDNPLKSTKYGSSFKSEVEKHKWVSKPLFGREGLGVLKSQNYSSFDEFVRASEKNLGGSGSDD